jgi:hypothetical protein
VRGQGGEAEREGESMSDKTETQEETEEQIALSLSPEEAVAVLVAMMRYSLMPISLAVKEAVERVLQKLAPRSGSFTSIGIEE